MKTLRTILVPAVIVVGWLASTALQIALVRDTVDAACHPEAGADAKAVAWVPN